MPGLECGPAPLKQTMREHCTQYASTQTASRLCSAQGLTVIARLARAGVVIVGAAAGDGVATLFAGCRQDLLHAVDNAALQSPDRATFVWNALQRIQ